MTKRNLVILTGLAALLVTIVTATASGGGVTAIEPQVVNDSTLKALSTTVGGADVLPTTRTVAHWFGQTTDPSNGVTYGYNMVGSNPNTLLGRRLLDDGRGRHHADHRARRRLDVRRHVCGRRDARIAAVREQRLWLDSGRHRGGRVPERTGLYPRRGRRTFAG